MVSHVSKISVLILGLLVAAGTAHAATYVATSKNRQFCCTTPPAFIIGQPALKGGFNSHAATNVSVTNVMSKTRSIMVGANQLIYQKFAFHWCRPGMTTAGCTLPIAPSGFKFIKGDVSQMNGAGTLMKSGGVGSFSFCPKSVFACTEAKDATPSPTFNGRIYGKPGVNKFGGTMKMLGTGNTNIGRWSGTMSMYPLQLVKLKLMSSDVGASMVGQVLNHMFPDLSTVTVTHTAGSVLTPIMSNMLASLSGHGGGPFTTGTRYFGVTDNATPAIQTVKIKGYDKRPTVTTSMGVTPGSGVVQLVAGRVFNTFNNQKNGSRAISWRTKITLHRPLPEPTASLGLALGAVVLLVIGLVRRSSVQR
jgi:hypothetical protein